MSTIRLSIVTALVLALSIAPAARAVDEGQTQPRLNNNSTFSNTTVDVISLTNGSGNVKGYQCSETGTLNTKLNFYVDGGAAQVIDFSGALFYTSPDGTTFITDMVPVNIRFGSSIRVTLQKTSGTGVVNCAVSWGLD